MRRNSRKDEQIKLFKLCKNIVSEAYVNAGMKDIEFDMCVSG